MEFAQAHTDVQQAVDAAFTACKALADGNNADYIPALANVSAGLFGIAVVTADGTVHSAGDVNTEVSIQSISKVFTMAQVIQEQGPESIEQRIGVDATGARFNSIIAIEAVRTVVGAGAAEMNSLVNPGRHRDDQHGDGSVRQRGLGQDHRLPQRRRGP
jgi:glutaminase